MLRICLAGATGWAGSELARAIATTEDLSIVTAVARKDAGRHFAEIDVAARRVNRGVLACGNFALTVVLLQKFAEAAARLIPQWEIIDYASDGKVDAPSGTARELAHRLSNVRPPEPTSPETTRSLPLAVLIMARLREVSKVSRYAHAGVVRALLVATAILLIVFGGTPSVLAEDAPGTDPDSVAKLRDALCRDAWSRSTMLGRVAIEHTTLFFDSDGTTRQHIRDDTGVHDMRGNWSLEVESGRVSLVLEKGGLRIHGRYRITLDAIAGVIHLQYDDKSRVMTFEREARASMDRS